MALTPGPWTIWTVETNNPAYGRYFIDTAPTEDAPTENIAIAFGEDNAHLLASAQILLESVMAMTALIEEHAPSLMDTTEYATAMHALHLALPEAE